MLIQWPSGAPMASKDLAKLGISGDLAVHYARTGWLTRLGHGVYNRPGESLSLKPCLKFLESGLPGLHVGGKTALDWYGIRQYVSQRPITQLYGWKASKLPEWFTRQFPAEYHRKRLFREDPAVPLHAGPFEKQADEPCVSEPERAFLEILSDVGVRQPLAEARELAQSAYSLRESVLATLLRACVSVKTVRLCLMLGRESRAPWVKNLDPGELPMGSARPWVSKSADGLLILKR